MNTVGPSHIYIMEITNKVAQSGIITINLEELYPQEERILLDIKNQLFQGLILREKDFREYVKNEDWSKYTNKFVAITCTTDAIVPTWAYMLLTIHLQPYAKEIVFGNLETLETIIYHNLIKKLNINDYKNTRVVVKGCSRLPVPTAAYLEITRLLSPVVKSIMYGEPCSTVPLYKKNK